MLPFVLRAANMYVFLIYLSGSCLHLSLGTLVLVLRELQCEAGMGCVQSIKSEGIHESGSLGNQMNAAVA